MFRWFSFISLAPLLAWHLKMAGRGCRGGAVGGGSQQCCGEVGEVALFFLCQSRRGCNCVPGTVLSEVAERSPDPSLSLDRLPCLAPVLSPRGWIPAPQRSRDEAPASPSGSWGLGTPSAKALSDAYSRNANVLLPFVNPAPSSGCGELVDL